MKKIIYFVKTIIFCFLIQSLIPSLALAQAASQEAKPETKQEAKEETKEERKEDRKEERKEDKREQKKEERKDLLKSPSPVSFKPVDEDVLFKNIDYPELQVVPRATDRLTMEASVEKDRKNSFFWTLQTPAVASFVAGLATYKRYQSDPLSDQQKIDHDRNSFIAMGVGLGWLGLNYYLMSTEPYNEGLNRINKVKKTDRRSELIRERLAEEVFEKQARTMKFFNNLSIVTNAAAILGCIDKTSTDYQVGLIIPLALSLTPYFFSQRYVDVYEKHLEYKRKIYVPISLFDLQYDQKTQTFNPVYGLAWNF